MHHKYLHLAQAPVTHHASRTTHHDHLSFLKGEKHMAVLVTGGAGYIGSVTVELLRAQGEAVVILDNLTRGYRQAVPKDAPFYEGNLGDRALVKQITRAHNIEACVHFAAYAYVGESVEHPARYYENNVEQGTELLGALKDAGV